MKTFYERVLTLESAIEEALSLLEARMVEESEKSVESAFSEAEKILSLTRMGEGSRYARTAFLKGTVALLDHPDREIRMRAVKILSSAAKGRWR